LDPFTYPNQTPKLDLKVIEPLLGLGPHFKR
jgi:hypothetical protein